MSNYITVLDGLDAQVKVKARERAGGIFTQVTEMEAVTSYVNLDLDENGVSVVAAPSKVHNAEIYNRGDVPLYVKIYNKASAPTNGDTPIRVWEILPGQPDPWTIEVSNGIDCPLGIGLRCTTGFAHADTGAPATNACLLNLGHIPDA